MHKLFSKMIIALMLPALATVSRAENIEPPEPGPANAGIRLRLMVENHHIHDTDRHEMRLEIINTSAHLITLKSPEVVQNPSAAVFREHLLEGVRFDTVPETPKTYVQTMATDGKQGSGDQSRITIESGKSFTIDWSNKSNSLTNGVGCFLNFPRPGAYYIRARVTVRTNDDTLIKLWSNEQAFIVDGSRDAPNICVTQVMRSLPDKQIVYLVASRIDGIKKGEIFSIQTMGNGRWKITVTEVKETHSVAKVTHDGTPGGGIPPFPKSGARVSFDFPPE